MKVSELVGELHIAISNEEDKLLEKITAVHNVSSFTEREQFIIAGLIRKSLVSKINHKGCTFVSQNKQ
jgi:hypothetical protein